MTTTPMTMTKMKMTKMTKMTRRKIRIIEEKLFDGKTPEVENLVILSS